METNSPKELAAEELNVMQVNAAEAIKLAEVDMNFLAMLCLYDVMRFKFPPMFVAMWDLMKSKVHIFRDFSKIALGIPRGFAKTTLIKLWCVYCILFTKKSFITIISYNEDHPISIITDVCKMLSSPNIITLFGDWELNKDIDQQALKVFRFRGREIILKGVGAKGGIRGINYGNKRPDVIIFEDYQKKAESENEELSNNLYKEMIGTAMKAKSPFGCLYLFVGNMYPTPGAILKKLKVNDEWISLIVGGILADGTSLWEDLHPIKQLIDEYWSDLKAGCPEVFLAEVLNDEAAGIKAGIDITKIPKNPFINEIPQGRAVVIDPALDNPNSDYNGIGLVGLYDGTPILEKVDLGKYTPLDLIKQAIILAATNNCALICVENVAYQASLLFWFTEVCRLNQIEGFHFMPLNVGGKSKNAKIAATLKQLIPNNQDQIELYMADEVRPFVLNEIIKWNPVKKNNQDTTLDLLTFCSKVIEQHRDLMYMPIEAEIQLGGTLIGVPDEAETCPF